MVSPAGRQLLINPEGCKHSMLLHGKPCRVPKMLIMHQSITSLTIPRAISEDSHILVAPGIGFSLLCLARGSARGVLSQSQSSIILKKSAIFALSLKQMSSSSFHMFIYARSEQCDLGPIYTINEYAEYQNLSW